MYDHGYRARAEIVTLFALPNDVGHGRLGLTVTRKLGNAVARNRIKRLLREIYRTERLRERAAIDVVVNAHPSIHERERGDIERAFLRSFDDVAERATR